MAREKSAKDKAFDNERAKFRHEIRFLEEIISQKEKELQSLHDELQMKDEVILKLQRENKKLIEVSGLSDEEFKTLIDDAVNRESIAKHIRSFEKVASVLHGMGFFRLLITHYTKEGWIIQPSYLLTN